MNVFECHTLSSPQINKGLFHFDCEEKGGVKKHTTC